MKKTLLALFLFAICFKTQMAISQTLPIDKETGAIIYSEVITVDSVSKDELYKRAKSCFVTLFKNSSDVIKNENSSDGTITGKGVIKAYARALGTDYDGGYVNFFYYHCL